MLYALIQKIQFVQLFYLQHIMMLFYYHHNLLLLELTTNPHQRMELLHLLFYLYHLNLQDKKLMYHIGLNYLLLNPNMIVMVKYQYYYILMLLLLLLQLQHPLQINFDIMNLLFEHYHLEYLLF